MKLKRARAPVEVDAELPSRITREFPGDEDVLTADNPENERDLTTTQHENDVIGVAA